MSKETHLATYDSGRGPTVHVVRRWESSFGEAPPAIYVGSDRLSWIKFELNDEHDAHRFAKAVNALEANIDKAYEFFNS